MDLLREYEKQLEEYERTGIPNEAVIETSVILKSKGQELKEKQRTYEPPEFVHQQHGSSAGADSKQFHIYRRLRNKEESRVNQMVEIEKEEEENRIFAEKRMHSEKEIKEKQTKKAAKRQKRKERQRLAKEKEKLLKDSKNTPDGKPTEGNAVPLFPDDDSTSSEND
ncbi:putative Protein of unknown function (DUF1168) [Blattamonas nauphoetae]|uniref:Uncharacterized protein n=1 Tax=Blattamonas nauphoetae TaxID=2049346 RepID=A0ABQ9XBV7_9EUKA|nr:putative Protein of unknown function (DUF1168) [Blattamonas nauphoetae]